MRRAFLIMLCVAVTSETSFSQKLKVLADGRETSLRGLSVVNDSVAWASGSKGWTANTSDKGKTWNWKQIQGYEDLDFRDIEAFSNKDALMVSAGSPAVILLTSDAGETWKEVYKNTAPEIFLDGMDFWTRDKGIIFGDPIKSKMVLLKTEDGGLTWKDVSADNKFFLSEGEAGFAASGTGIRTFSDGSALIATGGTHARLFTTRDYGATWKAFECPVIQGKSSTDPFSIAFKTTRQGIAAGGDYLRDTLRSGNLMITKNGGRSWKRPRISTWGYRSAVEYISKNTVLAAGTSGVDISTDGGKTWINFSGSGYHTVRKSKSGNWVLLTGNKGKIVEYIAPE